MEKNHAFTRYLEQSGLGQNEFARKHGIEPSLLSRYVNRAVNIPLPVAVQIEEATQRAVPVSSWVQQ